MRYCVYLLLVALFFSASVARKAPEIHKTSGAVIRAEGYPKESARQPSVKNNRQGPAAFKPIWKQQNNNQNKTRQNSDKQSKITCGVGPNANRIVNGVDAIKNSWPSMVAVIRYGEFWCGGSLLDNYHVLTAAHCLDDFVTSPDGLTVNLGMHTLLPNMDPRVTRKISKVMIHKQYYTKFYYNDIAILKMTTPVKFTKNISPICLPVDYIGYSFAKKDVTVLGWGETTVPEKPFPTVLQQVGVVVTYNSVCKRKYANTILNITDDMICADKEGKDSCQGDSGGPLLLQPGSGEPWIQIGVVSGGAGCALPEYPGVYTRVTSYIEWINDQIRGTTSG